MENNKVTREELEKKTVSQLRDICRGYGLTLQKNGKKFTKPELIENIMNRTLEWLKEEEPKKAEKREPEKVAEVRQEEKAQEQPKEKEKKERKEKIFYRNKKYNPITLESLIKKYGKRKSQGVYDNELVVGSYVCFVYHVITKDGKEYDKLRTAKVIAVNRKQELVRIQTLLGTLFELSFEELLFIRRPEDYLKFPKDIRIYLRQSRTKEGEEQIHEKFGQSIATN